MKHVSRLALAPPPESAEGPGDPPADALLPVRHDLWPVKWTR